MSTSAAGARLSSGKRQPIIAVAIMPTTSAALTT
jgi:hypothetical protein